MRKKKIFFRMITAILACIFLLGALSLTAYATGDGGDGETPVTDDGSGDGGITDPGDSGDSGAGDSGSGDSGSGESGDSGSGDSGSPDPGEPDPVGITPTDAPADGGDSGYTDEGDLDNLSTYTEPEHLDELPEVSEADVPLATSIAVPAATVSDASLLSGIIMWLCVAVGIAVVVGVLVSKRTRRRGP